MILARRAVKARWRLQRLDETDRREPEAALLRIA
jgi:hypothetical protein